MSRVLVVGATGFVGRAITARLLADGHTVTGAVRDTGAFVRRFPGCDAVRIDMNRDLTAEAWLPRLGGIDAVINCAGILQGGRGQSIEAIHTAAPVALFHACRAAGVRRVIQISAVSADSEAGTDYARTKRAADQALAETDLDWVILRPSLIYGTGSFGGSSALRGVAGFPFLAPLIGRGDQPFQPIFAEDLAAFVARLLGDTAINRQVLDPIGPETLTLREIVLAWRRWLDLPGRRALPIPLGLMRLLARAGDLLGIGPLNSTALAQLDYGNTSRSTAFADAAPGLAQPMAAVLARHPSSVQDRWHARLYFLQPLVTAMLALLWLGSGLVGLLRGGAQAQNLLAPSGIGPIGAQALAVLACLWDIALAAAVLFGRRWRWIGGAQVATILAYTAALTVLAPDLWLDPLGPLLKNLPILVLIGVWMALADQR
jgi:uncharacterized protein YbjT (DUF2867 family)